MLYRKLLFSLAISIIYLQAFGEVFKVTTNADAGPGSLRNALIKSASNGNTEKDYIYFEISGTDEASRTIVIKTELPVLTSNLVIDGSTQAGTKFGLSDARVRLTPDRKTYIAQGYYGGALAFRAQKDIEIYGLMIEGFSNLRFINNNFSYYVMAGIYNAASDNIIVGAPGKGNYFIDNDYEVYAGGEEDNYQRFPLNLKYQSNVIRHTGMFIQNSYIAGIGILFGGDTPEEGNSFSGQLAIGGKNVTIANNLFSIDRNGNYLTLMNSSVMPSGENLIIKYNKNYGVRYEIQYSSHVNMYGNIEYNSAHAFTPLNIYAGSDIIIGSDDENLKNIYYGTSAYTIVAATDNLQLLKNSIYCSDGIFINHSYKENVPVVLINNNTEYSGTAKPHSYIYIYEDNTGCEICNPVVFVAKIQADVNGNWKYTGNLKGKRMLSNSLLGTASSEFATPWFEKYQSVLITNPSCGKKNGELTINGLKYTLKVIWYDDKNNKVGEGIPLKKLGPGKYYAVCYNGNCQRRTEIVTLKDVTPSIDDKQMVKTNPSCNKGGSITQLQLLLGNNHRAEFKWADEANKVWGDDRDVYNLPAGSYTLTVTDVETGCFAKYGPVVLTQTNGPAIDETAVNIKQADCGQSNGSITGIKVSGAGKISYRWINNKQITVATTVNLANQQSGTYTLTVNDESQCDPITSKTYQISEINGVTLNTNNIKIQSASCGLNNGAITGISVSGANQYEWTNDKNVVVSTELNLANAKAGYYKFTAYYGLCSATTNEINVTALPGTNYPVYASKIMPSCTGENTGSIEVITDGLPVLMRWSNGQNINIGNTHKITLLQPGNYNLYFTDQNGCETFYATYKVGITTPLNLNTGRETVINDHCSLNNGGITGVNVTGGLPPYTYRWIKAQGNTVIGNSTELHNVPQGTYILEVQDASACNTITKEYTIDNIDNNLATPAIANTDLCTPGLATLTVSKKDYNLTYAIYDHLNDLVPITENNTGVFKIQANTNRSYYVSAKSGSCESARATVNITVGISNLNIANTITPNGDGINDYWTITGIENYPSSSVKLYNRNGQKVFESTGYSAPFNGTLNGSYLPSGTYYYIISLSANCTILSGHLMLMR